MPSTTHTITITPEKIPAKRVTFNSRCRVRTPRTSHSIQNLRCDGTDESSLWYSASELQNCRREAKDVVDLVRQKGISFLDDSSQYTFLGLERYRTQTTLLKHTDMRRKVTESVLKEQRYHREIGSRYEGTHLLIALALSSVTVPAGLEARNRAHALRREVVQWEEAESCSNGKDRVSVESSNVGFTKGKREWKKIRFHRSEPAKSACSVRHPGRRTVASVAA